MNLPTQLEASNGPPTFTLPLKPWLRPILSVLWDVWFFLVPPRFLCFNEVDRSGNSIKKILDPTLYIVQLWEYYCSFSRIGALTVALPLKWLGVGENCKVFVILLLMAHWLQVRKPEEEICILELFAGRSRLAKLSHAIGIPSQAHDLLFDDEYGKVWKEFLMDINSSAGYMSLALL